ncbi:LytR C-terminal domain-containing protein [Nocardioides sp. GCM10027113]|uniref:LytR C-terminal domain-containing protein n=1 Tax=unclassified Nocardioides TaxID=2615069 RepID=UPI003615FD34
MQQAAKSTMVLAGLGLVLVAAAIWGWTAATEPFPGRTELPACVDRPIAQGEKVFADQVTVSVYNASDRNGLASRTMTLFTDAGFGEGDTGNAPRSADVKMATIWTEDPGNPAVKLVQSRLGKKRTVIEEREGLGVGVTVLVGDGFKDLVKGRRAVKATEDTEVCSPQVD